MENDSEGMFAPPLQSISKAKTFFLLSAPSGAALQESLRAVEHAICIVSASIDREHTSLQHDRFARRSSEMPFELRQLYEASSWRHHDVYLWPQVLQLSQEGHARAAVANAALRHLHYRPRPSVPGATLAAAAVSHARGVAERVGPRVRTILARRMAERAARRRAHAKEYQKRRKEWVEALERASGSRSEGAILSARQRDRQLLMATRASSGIGGGMTAREVDLIFSEIEAAGGTAGGLERWGRSITGIPDHDPHNLPPASDGGGVLIENPLSDHYLARNINPWTRAERLLFLEKYLIHAKNFRKISTFFKHKSVEDVVRFYFDNKKHFKLKQLMKEHNVRRRGSKKSAVVELSMMPHESRSIKDNFIHQKDMQSESETEAEKDNLKAEKLCQESLGRGWDSANRQALIFALCRFDVTLDEEDVAMPMVWSNIASVVGNKTPRQCRQFYFEYKTVLGLGSYSPPRPPKRSAPSPSDCSPQPAPRKQLRSGGMGVIRGNNETSRTEIYVNGDI